MMRSLLAPLVVGLLLSLAAVFGVQWSAVRATIDTGMRNFIAGELAQDADELFSALVLLSDDGARLALEHFDPVFATPDSGRYFQVAVGGKVVLRSQSLAAYVLPEAPTRPDGRQVIDAPGPDGQSLLLSTSGYVRDGVPVTIAVAADLKPVQAEIGKLLASYTSVSLVMFGLLVVLQIVIVRLVFARLRRVQSDVGRLERGEITQLREDVPSEVLPLVREVNRLLALLNQRLRRSREALGNLAHALKAPLTVLTHMADEPAVRAHPQLGPPMAEQLAVLRARIDSELRRARIAGGRAPGPMLDLGAELEALVATCAKLHEGRGLDIVCRIDSPIPFNGDREDLLELCGNLVDNACKWAASRVAVTARDDAGITLIVEDDGPGCAPDDLEKLARRGVRLDESTEGDGLGLAISRNIAASFGATLDFGRSDMLGGFRVSVRIPEG